MTRDLERINRIINALEPADQDALICSLPMNVLLISGYWPVIGTALAIATRDGAITILAPQDEEELARRGWADEVRTFSAGSLKELKRVADIVRKPLGEIANDMGIGRNSVVGYESAACFEPVSYAAMHLYGAEIFNLLDEALPSIAL
ncbi:MAG TPA: aminopeptidase P family N-terminal domain-containing protein, partial [Blastocatellia bacterium]